MSPSELNILQVSTSDRGGGAEGSALSLFREYRLRGYASWLAVGTKTGSDADVFELPRRFQGPAAYRPAWWLAQWLRERSRGRGAAARLSRWLERVADPERRRDWWHGREEFHFPGSRELLGLVPDRPHVVHCHNLHGWYFDLEFLPELSRRIPLILNLRDAWLLTGHGAYPMECTRWKNGCGNCPDLTRYPPIRADSTAANRQRKARIYARSRLYVTAPSTWLLDMARDSGLNAVQYRMIPNGIDVDTFCPGDRQAARQRLGLPSDGRIVLMVSASARNVYKDPRTMQQVIDALTAGPVDDAPLVVCLGARCRAGGAGPSRLRQVPFQHAPADVADYYRAADVFVHTARAEAFGKTVTEAMACGTPVVASAVGGIPEQIVDRQTGVLVPPRDAAEMVRAIRAILGDAALRHGMGRAGAEKGRTYSLKSQADRFLAWYGEIVTGHSPRGVPGHDPPDG